MKFLIVANWKMNLPTNIDEWLNNISSCAQADQVVVAPPTPLISRIDLLSKSGQNVSQHKSGSLTGEISANILKISGVKYCLVGHSERRKNFGETIDNIVAKVERLLEERIIPIVCIGESISEVDRREIVLEKELSRLKPFSGRIVIAYEPIWAIGSSQPMEPDEAFKVKEFIQTIVDAPVLYGGSVDSKNAFRFKQAGLDGILVGKASLDVKEFNQILMEC